MLKQKHDSRSILLSLWLLFTIFVLLGSISNTYAAASATYYASDYNVLNGTYLSGSVPASLQTVDSDYLTVGSSPSATSASSYNPLVYNLLRNTSHVSGAIGDLVSNNDVHMVYHSYPSQTSAKTLNAHQETTTIGGNPYYIQKLESADSMGSSLSASMATTGRHLLGRFVYPLAGGNSIPASTWTQFYRAWKDPDPNIAYDSVGSGNNGDGTQNITWTHVIGSGTNRFMVIGISIRTVTVSVLNVAVDGQMATFLRSDVQGTQVKGEIWYLISPNSGSKTVTVNLSGISKASGGSVSYTGVAQTSPLDNHRAVLYAGDSPSISLTTTVASDWIFSNLAVSGTATVATHGGGQVHRYYEIGTGGSGTSRAGADGDDKPTTAPGSYTMFWNMTFYSDVIAQAVALKPAPPSVGHVDVDILVLKSDGTTRNAIATNVADSADLPSTPTTLSGTYFWATYTVADQTDYLEINYYVEVASATSGISAYLRIDDSALPTVDQTRISNIMLPSEYTAEVEFTGASNTYSWTQLQWTVDNAWTTGSVTVTLQLYNHTLGAYPNSGNGFISYTSNPTANKDETKAQTLTVNSQHFRDAAGNWKIKVKGMKTVEAAFDLRADWVEFMPTFHSEYVVSTEFVYSSVTTRTPTQLNFTVVSEYGISSVSVTVQVWNYSANSYVNSGQGYLRYTSSGANETVMLSVNVNPQFYASNGSAKIKAMGMLSTTTQYKQRTNQIKLAYGYEVVYIHDVAVVSVTASANEVVSGQIVNITVVVRNNGNATEAFDVAIFYNETMIGTKTVTSLVPSDQQALEFAWNTTGVAEASYRISAEASLVSGESDTSNNRCSEVNLVKVRAQGLLPPFDWGTALLYMLPVPLVLFLLFLGLRRKKNKNSKPHVKTRMDTFSGQYGMTHGQMVGKKMLLEIDPTSDYNMALSSFVSEAKSSGEPLFIVTNRNSALHSVFSEAGNVNFLLLWSRIHYAQQISERETLLPASDLSLLLDTCARIQKVQKGKTINLLFDNLSDIILRCEFEKTYKFTRLLLEAISSPKTTALFVFIPTAHDQEVSSSIRGLFQNQLVYTKNGARTENL